MKQYSRPLLALLVGLLCLWPWAYVGRVFHRHDFPADYLFRPVVGSAPFWVIMTVCFVYVCVQRRLSLRLAGILGLVVSFLTLAHMLLSLYFYYES